jgi:polyferredoxin
MGKLGKKSLINWGSTNSVLKKQIISLFSTRNIIYFVSLILCVILSFAFASKKEPFLLNVNKTTKLYKIQENSQVSNNYILTFHNTSNKDYTYDIKVEDDKNFRIKRFKAFKLSAKKRIKKIFILETKRKLFLSEVKDSPIKIRIEAFSKEDTKIRLTREISFIYPRSDLIK